jgi:hypothetical protein
VRDVLQGAIEMGGTTLRDFVNQDGQPGYFRQSLYVYGREGQPCRSVRHGAARACAWASGPAFSVRIANAPKEKPGAG